MHQAKGQHLFVTPLFQQLTGHCSEAAKLSVWLLLSEMSRSGKMCKQALESASHYLIGQFFFPVFRAEVNQHSRTSPTLTQGEWEEGSRLLW